MGVLSGIALGLAVTGSIVSARNQYKAGKAEEKAAQRQGDAAERAGQAARRASESQAQLAEYNVADLQAKDATERGELDAQRFRARTRGLVGEQRAGIAAGNIDVGYGSAVDVQADATYLGELDALTVKTNAAREAWGYRVESEDLRQRAAIARQEGEAAAEAGRYEREGAYEYGKGRRSAGKYGAIGTLVGSGASLLEARYGFGRRR
jgi:hypothetical protein